jgi:parvulin-like peptidyl-prolyl isomerase
MKSFAQIIRNTAVLAAAALVLMAGCGKKSAPDVLARVGEQTITVADFKAELQRRIANRQAVPDRQKLLEEMISRATLVQRARAAGLENAVDVRRTFEDVLIAKLKEAELEPKVAATKVSPDEVRATYEKEIAHFTQPGKAHLAMIYLAANSKTETNHLAEITVRADEARRLALALPASVQGFGTVAADFSDDQVSRYRGGDAGWYTTDQLADRWPKEVVAAGLTLKNNGEISDVIRVVDGFYLVKKMDARPPVVMPFAQMQAGIERRLLTAKRARAEDEFRQSLRVAAKVQTDLQLLSRVDFPTQSVASAAVPPSLPRSP